MKKPKPPKGGGGLKAQQNYKKRLEDYDKFLKLKESNEKKARNL